MTTVDLSSYKQLFLETAKDYLKQLEEALHLLSKNGRDKQALATAHRAFHSLKSQSLVMQYPQTGQLAQVFEYIFADIIKNNRSTDNSLLAHSETARQHLKQSIDSIEKSNTEAELQPVINEIISTYNLLL